MADTFLSGTDGRVKVAGVVIAGITSWSLESQTAIIKIPHFEGPTDGLSRMWIPKLFGLSDAQGSIEGYFNVGAGVVSDAVFRNGTVATLSLIISKGTAFGFVVNAVLSSIRIQDTVENQPVKFTANFEVNGVLGPSNTGV